MKAAFFRKNGGPEVLQYGEVPDPVSGPGEVLVDVHAASVNGADWKVRAGTYAPIAKFPYVPGRDFSGVVAVLGAGVTDLEVGDPVFGVVEQVADGCYAEKLAIRSAIVARKPASLSHVDAAALALIGLTALVSVEDTLKLKRGETILIQGGAGGVASFAVQLAKHIGAHVAATAGAKNVDFVRSLGADQVIDYTKGDFSKQIKDCDLVFDLIGGDVRYQSFPVLKAGGVISHMSVPAMTQTPPRSDVAVKPAAVKYDTALLDEISKLVAGKAMKPTVTATYSLDDALKAYEHVMTGHARGKVMLSMH
jgi:NADPH:quinone reductase-like Zn-dependent oxidoreductase